jgi:hypothetical protein
MATNSCPPSPDLSAKNCFKCSSKNYPIIYASILDIYVASFSEFAVTYTTLLASSPCPSSFMSVLAPILAIQDTLQSDYAFFEKACKCNADKKTLEAMLSIVAVTIKTAGQVAVAAAQGVSAILAPGLLPTTCSIVSVANANLYISNLNTIIGTTLLDQRNARLTDLVKSACSKKCNK